MTSQQRPGGKVPGSRDFVLTLSVIAAFVAAFVVLISDSAPYWLRGAVTVIMLPVLAVLFLGMWGSLLALPIWAMWKGARAADARLPPPGGTLTVAPGEGAMAPQAVPKDRPVPFRWGSLEWILSGLGIGGEVGVIVSLSLGRPSAATVFGAMFLIGAGGWLLKINRENRRG